jgi:ABC-2 type transport system ATP-binding protein
METRTLVAARGLTKRFKAGVTAISNVDLDIQSGMVTAVIGPDGAGKTTLLRLIAGLLMPDEGAISVCGHDILQEAEEARAEIGYMPQRFSLYEDLTVIENLALHADLRNLPADERADSFARLLDFTGLSRFTDRLAGNLSGGMKQKLGLGCVLISKPAVLLLDEPTVGVDPISRRELWSMVQTLVDGNTAVVWSTGYLDEGERCGSVVMLNEGQILYTGVPADLSARVTGQTWLLHGVGGDRRGLQRRINARPEVLDAVIQDATVRIVLCQGKGPPDPSEIGEGCAQIEQTPPRLEDAFVALLAEVSPPGAILELPKQETPNASSGPAIEAKSLTRRFGEFLAVDDVSFSVARGEVFGLLGPNGAGKSTVFRMLCGLLPASEGQALVSGFDLARAGPAARSRIGYVAQKFSLYEMLTGSQNLAFFGRTYGLNRKVLREKIDQIAGGLRLANVLGSRVADLSLGLKQRLALACAVIHSPSILFLDEPTAGVDPLTRREFWRHINGLAEEGVTVMVTTHFLEEAEYCDRVALMDNGHLVALGGPGELKAAYRTSDHQNPSLEDAFIASIKAAGSRRDG